MIMSARESLPVGLWVEAELRRLNSMLIPACVLYRGNYASGLVLLKINGLKGKVRLLTQERDFETGMLCWINALPEEISDEKPADEYIQRALSRDPDLWAIEIEDPDMRNIFEE
ncbi:MAG: DUF1491 family protein [Alphaproteobacteria bacterium]|nr:DUF1491 family protein [Alphaproteobacteria bacterium]